MKHRRPSPGSLATLFAVNLAVAAVLFPWAKCHAQVDVSAVNGVVTDPSGAAVPVATITINSARTGFSRVVQTDANGAYSLPNLQPGVYVLSAEAPGFKKVVVTALATHVGQAATQDFHLEIGDTKQVISVNAKAPLLDASNNQMGTIITNQLMTQLPLNGRNFLQLNLLSPGVIHDKTGNTFEAIEINPTATSFSVNGQKSDYNNFLVDGVVMRENEIGTNTFSPSIEAVQEFQTTTSNYSAALGSEAAAQVNLTLKSGTNRIHGAGWEFLRNNDLDARSFFQVGGVPPFKQNQFGANIGGPVVLPKIYNGRDKTFFMFNYEGLRRLKDLPYSGIFPTPAQLGGDLSTIVKAGKPLMNPFTGQPFTNNVIPTASIRPAQLPGFLQSGIGKGPWDPVPNLAGDPSRNYFRNDSQNFFSNQYITRVDRQVSSKTSVYGHFVDNRETSHQPQVNPNWALDINKKSYSIGAHATHIFSPTFLFDLAGGYSYYEYRYLKSTDFTNDITNQILHITGNATIPGSFGAPSWGVAGYANLGESSTFGPRLWRPETTSIRPAFTWTRARHNMRWGLDFEYRELNFPEIFQTDGNYSFTGIFTGYALGDFLLDLPAGISHSPDPFAPDFRQKAYAPYFQDDWKLSSNLTLNLGIRYEWTGVPLSANHRSFSNLYFPTGGASPELVIANDAGPINFGGVQATLFTGTPFVRASSVGLPEALVFNDNRDIAPRFGFAYRLPGLSNTVIRGGYGIFYENDVNDKWVEGAINAPFVRSESTTLDTTNFQGFDPNNPYVESSSTAAQIFWNATNHHQAMLQAWNLVAEKTVKNFLISAGYAGNMAHHLANRENPNQAVPGPGAIASRRTWTTWGPLTGAGEDGSSNYHSLQAKVQGNIAHGLTLLAGYTYARCIDDTGGTYVGEGERGATIQDYRDRKADRGLCAQDIRHRFVLSYVYELPVGKGKRFLTQGGPADWVLGGWQVNGITTAMSGSPSTITQTFNVANSDSGTPRPDVIGDVNGLSHSRPRGQQVKQFFNTAALRQANLTNGTYRFGDAGRDIMIGPGDYIYDFAVYKNFRIGESAALQFRTESFNIFNRAIFSKPDTNLGDPNFGSLTATSHDPREIQFALKLTW